MHKGDFLQWGDFSFNWQKWFYTRIKVLQIRKYFIKSFYKSKKWHLMSLFENEMTFNEFIKKQITCGSKLISKIKEIFWYFNKDYTL